MALPAPVAVFTGAGTPVPRLKYQIRPPSNRRPSITTGQSHAVAAGRTSSRTRETCELMLEATLERPGMKKPAGRKLRSLGSSVESRLPRPLVVRPSLVIFDERAPRTIGAAEARMVPAEEARRPETSAILF